MSDTPSLAQCADTIAALTGMTRSVVMDFAAALLAEARKDQPGVPIIRMRCPICLAEEDAQQGADLLCGRRLDHDTWCDSKMVPAAPSPDLGTMEMTDDDLDQAKVDLERSCRVSGDRLAQRTAAPPPEPAPLCEEAREWMKRTDQAWHRYRDATVQLGRDLEVGRKPRDCTSETEALIRQMKEAAAAWSAAKVEAGANGDTAIDWMKQANSFRKARDIAEAERDAAVRERDRLRKAIGLLDLIAAGRTQSNGTEPEEIQPIVEVLVDLRARLAAAEADRSIRDAEADGKRIVDLKNKLAAAEREKHAWAAKRLRKFADWIDSHEANIITDSYVGDRIIRDRLISVLHDWAREEAAAKAKEAGND